jgi:hypothetical protein
MVAPIEVVRLSLLACKSQEHFQKCFLFTNVQSAGDGDMCIVWGGTTCPGGRVSCASSLAGGHGVLRRMCRIHHQFLEGGAPRAPSVIVVHGVRHGITALQSLRTRLRYSIIPSFHISSFHNFARCAALHYWLIASHGVACEVSSLLFF